MNQSIRWSKIFWRQTFFGVTFLFVLLGVAAVLVLSDPQPEPDVFSGIALPGDGRRGLLRLFIFLTSGFGVFAQVYLSIGFVFGISVVRRVLLSVVIAVATSIGYLLVYFPLIFSFDLGRHQTFYVVFFLFLGLFLVPSYVVISYGWFRQQRERRKPAMPDGD